MDATKPLAVKQFVQALQTHCKALSRDELINVIIGLGLDARPYQRREYLRRLMELASPRPTENDVESVLARCTDLLRQIHERWMKINDGTWWDDPDGEAEYDYDDEIPAMLTPDQEEDLLALFSEADALFLETRYAEAERIYSELLPLFLPDEHDRSVTTIEGDFDLRETRARHARCVYETTSSDRRLDHVLEALNSETRWHGSWADPERLFPRLLDVANAAAAEPDDFGSFIETLKRTLRESARSGGRDEALYLEATRTTGGIEGLRAVVEDWGGSHPRAYFEWMRALRGENMWAELVAAARAALAEVPGDSPNHRMTRRFAATMLAEAGDVVNDPVLALEGRRSRFTLQPSDATFAELLRCATRCERRQEELEGAVAFLEHGDSTLYVESLLIADRLGETFSLLDSCRPLGWSSGRGVSALCFSAILAYRVLPCLSDYPTIDRYFRSSLIASSAYPYWPEIDGEDPSIAESGTHSPELHDDVVAGLSHTNLPIDLEKKYLAWADSIGRRRVDAIVSNLHRGAYRRAAIVLVALAERLLADGQTHESTELVAHYRTKYNRHRAFKAELAVVLSQSALAPPEPEDGSL